MFAALVAVGVERGEDRKMGERRKRIQRGRRSARVMMIKSGGIRGGPVVIKDDVYM